MNDRQHWTLLLDHVWQSTEGFDVESRYRLLDSLSAVMPKSHPDQALVSQAASNLAGYIAAQRELDFGVGTRGGGRLSDPTQIRQAQQRTTPDAR